MEKTCAFTGHRELDNLDFCLLDRVILNLIKNGVTRFLCGMARGFDLSAAESVVALQKKYPNVELVACVPCQDQSHGFSRSDKDRYDRILAHCAEVIVLSGGYYNGCMHVRDRFMVDNAEIVLSYLRRKSGGTYYTVKYANRLSRKVIEL